MANAAPVETTPAPDKAFELYADVPKPKMVPVLLERHYRPAGDYEIVGHWQPEVQVKNAAGQMVTVQAREFIADVPMPPPQPGVGGASLKLWAGTLVRLTADEARTVKRAGIGSIEVED